MEPREPNRSLSPEAEPSPPLPIPDDSLAQGSSLHAAIDIGTNSFHLVVARADADGGFDILTTEKEMVRLGSGAHEMKHLQPDAIERGVRSLARMAKVARSFGAVDLVAVATSAVREADNGAEFVERAEREAGVEIDVIAGTEEARLIHLGVLQALPVYDRRLVLADIGGGSTELGVGQGGTLLAARSMKLGSIRLTQRFFEQGDMSKKNVAACRNYVREALAATGREFRRYSPELAIGSSGTISTVAAMAAAARGEAHQIMNGSVFRAEEVEALVEVVAKASPEKRRTIPGIDPRRCDIISGGIVLLAEIFRSIGLDEMTVSSYALREGVLLDRFGGSPSAGLARLTDLRRANVNRLTRTLDPDPTHAETCAALAVQLFDATQALHGLDEADRELLEFGALLHNVGLFISHSSHHKHSYYVIRNNDQLTGFSEREIHIMALIARYHRRGRPKDRHPELMALSAADQRRVKIMAGIVRIAIGLDRSHAGLVHALVVHHGDRTLMIEPRSMVPAADLELEAHSARERSALLSEVLEVEILVEPPM